MSSPVSNLHKFESGGIEFRVTRFKPREIYALAPRVAKIMIPLMGIIQSIPPELRSNQASAINHIMQGDVSILMAVMSGVADQLEHENNAALPRELMARTVAVGTDDKGEKKLIDLGSWDGIDEAFAGKFMTMMKVMFAVAQYNFSDFLSGG